VEPVPKFKVGETYYVKLKNGYDFEGVCISEKDRYRGKVGAVFVRYVVVEADDVASYEHGLSDIDTNTEFILKGRATEGRARVVAPAWLGGPSWVRAAVIVAALATFGVYWWGHKSVAGLEDKVEEFKQELQFEATQASQTQKDAETSVDVLRVLTVDALARAEGNSRLSAERASAASYYYGAVDACHELLGPTASRCEAMSVALNQAPAYPNDPGYIPGSVDDDLRRMRWAFAPVLRILCDQTKWPRIAYKIPPPQLIQACKAYGARVGQTLAGD
jgi:hypothetical protein